MKKLLAVLLAVVFVGSLAIAAEKKAAKPQVKKMTGIIVDNMCAGSHQADIAEFVKGHTKECALMPDCVKSGYSLFTEGKLLPFDEASSAKIEKFLKKKNSTLNVAVKAALVEDKLSLKSISNKKEKKSKEKK